MPSIPPGMLGSMAAGSGAPGLSSNTDLMGLYQLAQNMQAMKQGNAVNRVMAQQVNAARPSDGMISNSPMNSDDLMAAYMQAYNRAG
jgi:hypothetical protein